MPPQVDTWIIMEYCNRGSLQTAVPKGVFQRVDPDGTTRPNRLSIITTAAQLASAMAYVHSQVLRIPPCWLEIYLDARVPCAVVRAQGLCSCLCRALTPLIRLLTYRARSCLNDRCHAAVMCPDCEALDVQGVIHGDLCRGNVLMAASSTSPSGFDIKVCQHAGCGSGVRHWSDYYHLAERRQAQAN